MVRKCRAKDPSACRVHGNPWGEEPLNPFEAAMLRRLTPEQIEQIRYRPRKYAELAAANATRITKHMPDVIQGMSDNSPESVTALQAYNNEYHELKKNLSEEHLESLHSYTGLGYLPMNAFLRDETVYINSITPARREEAKTDLENKITELDAVFDAQRERLSPQTLYRVLHQDEDKKFISAESFAAKKGWVPGSVVTFPEYLSTTIDADFVPTKIQEDENENIDVVFIINTRKGIPVGLTATTPEATYMQDGERERFFFLVTHPTR